MNVDEFQAEVAKQRDRFFPQTPIEPLKRLSNYIQLRIKLSEDLFIAVRYNAQNGRQDFALIHKGKRIFGYDNLKSWHYHPFDEPDEHINCPKPSISKIFKEMKKLIKEKIRI